MSRNVVDAVIRMAYRRRRPVMVIASRNQIDSAEFGGGYVEGWTTQEFVRYVRARDPAGLITLCRDHGGPWQHPGEVSADLDEAAAMASSITSMRCDIRSGLDLVHIDTSRERRHEAGFEDAVRRLVAIYAACQETAKDCGRGIGFEIGLETQGGEADDPAEFRVKLDHLLTSLTGESLPRPTFVVAQTGTKVVGLENRGVLVDEPRTVGGVVGKLAEVCWANGVALKAHNVDYLPEHAMHELMANGTDAVNIAPEFGVVETKAFLRLLDRLRLPAQREEFLRLAYESGAWRKWFAGVEATDLQRSVAAGHYVFGGERFREIKRRVNEVCHQHKETVDGVLAAALDRAMTFYATRVFDTGHGAVPWNC